MWTKIEKISVRTNEKKEGKVKKERKKSGLFPGKGTFFGNKKSGKNRNKILFLSLGKGTLFQGGTFANVDR